MSATPPGHVRRRRRPTVRQRRARLALPVGALLLVVAVIVSGLGGGPLPHPPRPGEATGAGARDPFAYAPARAADFVARAVTGEAHPLFVKSPGGALATAARVAALRPMIDRAAAGSGVNPNLLEALVFVESAGRPEIIAGSDPADAAGLTQIVAQTGQALLGMHIELGQSRRLTAAIDAVAAGTRHGLLAPLLAHRAAIDDRFNPAKELAATVRYLQLAQRQFGREDLAIESYHMGIGNLRQVLADYDAGRPVPYAQLYFDTAPDRHSAAYSLLAGFGDDSSLYYWRVLGAVQIMRLYRSDRGALTRLASLQSASASNAEVLHPPDRTQAFSDPRALADAYQSRTLVPLPSNGAQLGLEFDPAMGSRARSVGAPTALYRGLRPVALRLLTVLAAGVRSLSGAEPLRVYSTVSDERYQQRSPGFPAATNGYSFQLLRRYSSRAQADGLQAMLDRLQALNLIAWAREPTVIDVTVASDAGAWLR